MKMLIGGKWVESSSGEWMEILNPGTQKVIDKVPKATVEDVQAAVEAAQYGKEAMRALTAHERYEILMGVASAIESRVEELGKLLAEEKRGQGVRPCFVPFRA